MKIKKPRLRLSKLRQLDIMMCLMLVLALGFRTSYTSWEKNVSTILIIVIFVLMAMSRGMKIPVRLAKKYLLWYTIVVFICSISYFWAQVNNQTYVYALIKDVFVPYVFVVLALVFYLKYAETPAKLFDVFVAAEFLVVLRAVIYTPWREMLSTFDSRLFASNLGQNYNDFTTQMALTAVICAYLAIYKNKKYNIVYVIFMFFILASASRKAIVVGLAGYVMLYLVSAKYDVKKLFKRIIAIAVICGALLVLIFTNQSLYSLIGEKLVSMITTLGQSSSEMVSSVSASDIDHSLHGRAVLREEAWKQFLNYPIAGLGYYNFQYFNGYGLYAHNNYLELLADLGIIGFIAYYSMYFTIIRNAMKVLKRGRERNSYAVFVMVFMIVLLILEYAHITFFRLYALIPITMLSLYLDYVKSHREIEA